VCNFIVDTLYFYSYLHLPIFSQVFPFVFIFALKTSSNTHLWSEAHMSRPSVSSGRGRSGGGARGAEEAAEQCQIALVPTQRQAAGARGGSGQPARHRKFLLDPDGRFSDWISKECCFSFGLCA
jgi:hypothetical protein